MDQLDRSSVFWFVPPLICAFNVGVGRREGMCFVGVDIPDSFGLRSAVVF